MNIGLRDNLELLKVQMGEGRIVGFFVVVSWVFCCCFLCVKITVIVI